FSKILLVNGHGSNTPLVDLVARKTVLATSSLCFATGYYQFLLQAFEPIRESKVMAHADEFETSLYLHLAPERCAWSELSPTTTAWASSSAATVPGTTRFGSTTSGDAGPGPAFTATPPAPPPPRARSSSRRLWRGSSASSTS